MEIKKAIASQYIAGLQMVRECIEKCPDEVWASGEHPRTFWRIAYHSLFYTHLYCMVDEHNFSPWNKHQDQAAILWDDDEDGIPPIETTYSRAEVLEYLEYIIENIPQWVQHIDLESPVSGFHWYPKINKLEHQLLNIRHLGVHIGQLQEILYSHSIDLKWISMGIKE